jgi:uncharacterized membrane protein YczE
MIAALKTLVRLIFGLFLFALGIALTIRANIGLAPWDVFHQGLGTVLGMTIGQVSILVGLVIVVFNGLMGERIGWGTLGNMLLIGLFLDLILLHGPIPIMQTPLSGALLAALGLLTIAVASYFYLSSGLGSGPRDGLMVVLTKRTGLPVGVVRNGIEMLVLVVGYLMGGFMGVGTFAMALLIGTFVQVVFRWFDFDVKTLEHRFIDEDLSRLKTWYNKRKNAEE